MVLVGLFSLELSDEENLNEPICLVDYYINQLNINIIYSGGWKSIFEQCCFTETKSNDLCLLVLYVIITSLFILCLCLTFKQFIRR